MDKFQAQAIIKQFVKLRKGTHLQLVDERYPQQMGFVMDASQSVTALCTRRAGKSYALALRLFRAAAKHPKSVALYIALTRESAKLIMWPVLQEINERYDVGAELTESNLTVTMPNGSMIKLVGADMKNFIERLRGPKYSEAQIDEAGSFRGHIDILVNDILTPALIDYNGALVLVGTPGVLPQGLFYDVTTKDLGYSKHFWTLYDNPYLPNAAEFVAGIKKKRGWSDANPTYRREYLGEWVLDLDALVYKFSKERNLYSELPTGNQFNRILVIDYGFNDQTAFGITTYSPTLKDVFQEHAEGHREMIPSQIASRIQQLRERFNPVKIVADTGALGKMITEEMIRRYHIPIQPAEKKEKMLNIHLMNGDFIDGRMKVHASLTALHDQYLTLIKDEDGSEDKTLPNDLCDVALYGFREARHYLGKLKDKEHAPGTKPWADREAKRLIDQDMEAFENEKRLEWWEVTG